MNLMDREIKNNLYDLYSSYAQHKALFEFWQQNKTIKTREEIKQRIEYVIKNKITQKNELETLLWVLGETYAEYKAKNSL